MRVMLRLTVLLVAITATATSLTTTPSPSVAETRSVSARSLLDGLAVRPETTTAWSPADFRRTPSVAGDCPSTRAAVLAEWSSTRTTGCAVASGVWTSLFDGRRTTDRGSLQVVRVVPPREAWRSGADTWSEQDRTQFANDLGYRWSLVPVTAGLSAKRASRGPESWLPPVNRCAYVTAWIGVKWRWHLAVDRAERAALLRVLSACGDPTMTRPTARVLRAPMPKGNLPHWRQIIAQDFTKDAPLGTFAGRYPNWAQYDSGRDSSWDHGRPYAEQGVYRSATTTSVHDGLWDCRVHTEGTRPQVCALTPTPDTSFFRGQRFGRYTVRFRTDAVPGYKIAWLLWPSTNEWSDGEIDFPEADLGGEISAAAHDVTGNPSRNAYIVGTGMTTLGWHTATIEWTPGRIRYILDGRSWTTTDPTAMPAGSMRWALQAESSLTAEPPSRSVSGHILIDWVTAYAYAP